MFDEPIDQRRVHEFGLHLSDTAFYYDVFKVWSLGALQDELIAHDRTPDLRHGALHHARRCALILAIDHAENGG